MRYILASVMVNKDEYITLHYSGLATIVRLKNCMRHERTDDSTAI